MDVKGFTEVGLVPILNLYLVLQLHLTEVSISRLIRIFVGKNLRPRGADEDQYWIEKKPLLNLGLVPREA